MDEIKVIERLATVEQENKSFNRRLGNLEKLTESVHTIANEIKNMRGDVNDITQRVNEIEKKPSKRWETVITALITALVGAAIGYVFRGGM
ncbi:MAG: hypothetical protein IJH36_03075 [Clostridia bacterium]|nr:hypothetical protein [Clostridia bacterium]MBQ3462084.1 hypothetical protein [Clostridia bacterium]MBQ3471479.1 hypothetical protein [Clostridia bacterium]MBQ9599410.1 hypothetical protein [Clostridia bacterium]MBR0471002.1 hypothetical protein [Clostridia bacterium]